MASTNTIVSEKDAPNYKIRHFISQGIMYFILALGAIIAIYPFIWMLQTSFKT